MSKGIIYICTTSVEGLIKIGRTDNFNSRMSILEQNGYWNVSGLKRFYAVRVDDYIEKEKLIHTIFSKSQVANSELFALDKNLAKDMLDAFEGEVIYPEPKKVEKKIDKKVDKNVDKDTTVSTKKNKPAKQRPNAFIYNGKEYECNYWQDVLRTVLKDLASRSDFIDTIKSSQLYPSVIREKNTFEVNNIQLPNGWFSSVNFSADGCIGVTNKLTDVFGLDRVKLIFNQ